MICKKGPSHSIRNRNKNRLFNNYKNHKVFNFKSLLGKRVGFFLASARCIIPFPQVRSTTFVFKAPHILGFAKQQKKHSLPAAAAATAAAAASLQKGFKTGLILKHSVQCFKSALHRHRIYQILLNRLYKKVLWSQLSCAMCNPIKKMTIIKFNQVAKKHPV